MDFTVEIGKQYGVLPFEILKQDKDEVIMLINYFVLKGEDQKPIKAKRKDDGFWDF